MSQAAEPALLLNPLGHGGGLDPEGPGRPVQERPGAGHLVSLLPLFSVSSMFSLLSLPSVLSLSALFSTLSLVSISSLLSVLALLSSLHGKLHCAQLLPSQVIRHA